MGDAEMIKLLSSLNGKIYDIYLNAAGRGFAPIYHCNQLINPLCSIMEALQERQLAEIRRLGT